MQLGEDVPVEELLGGQGPVAGRAVQRVEGGRGWRLGLHFLLLLRLLGLDLHDGGVVAGGLRQDEVMVMAVVVIPIMEDLVVVVGEAPQVLALIRVPFGGVILCFNTLINGHSNGHLNSLLVSPFLHPSTIVM